MNQQDFIEIERKFLVTAPPADYLSHRSVKISQTYLSTPGTPPVLRVRKYGSRHLLTIKKRDRENPMICGEVEIPIEQSHYQALKAMGQGHELAKTRYLIPFQDFTIELDIFESDLSGLILAEVEFSSSSQADSFTPPRWFGTEVTGDLRYSNNSLSINGRPDKEEIP